MKPERQPNVAELTQDEQNEHLLGQSELGVIVQDAYREATSIDPRLSEMKIVAIDDEEEKSHGFATPGDVSESGKHEVHIRLNNLDEILGYYKESIKDYPASIESISERMHLKPDQVTPQLLYVQSILHEMGHVTEYMDYENDMDSLRLRNKQERTALPLGYHSLTKLMDSESTLRQSVDQHWEELRTKHGVDDIDGLARVQGTAYRNLTSERHADMFAADVFDANPQMTQQLSQSSVETYRNFPVAA